MSEFAEALQQLLDSTDFYTRDVWCDILDVCDKTIKNWLQDQAIPKPHHVSAVITLLRDDPERTAINRFYAMARRRATEVSPHGAQMLPTVEAYANRSAFSGLSRALAKMKPEEQEVLLANLYPDLSQKD